MAIHRGIQSAIFYYLACTPCAEMRVRKRRKQEAERDRVERALLEVQMPGLYRHPEPSTTNPYWQTEIEAGPIPSRTRKKMAENSKAGRATSTRSNIASTVSVDASLGLDRSDSALSGIGPYGRTDGNAQASRTSNISGRPRQGTATSSRDGLPLRPPRAAQPRSRNYVLGSNPAINDMHPPTTRKVESREDVAWMMQPPPLPEVMNGTAMSQLSRHSSSASRPTTSARSKETSRPSSKTQIAPPSPPSPLIKGQARYLTVPISPQSSINRNRTLSGHQNAVQRSEAGSIRRPEPALRLSDAAIRPPLSTVTSQTSMMTSENRKPQRSGSFASPTIVSKQRISRSPPLVETRLLVSAQDSPDAAGTDGLEQWTTPDFELPDWIHEHTKREGVRERWSFDM